MNNNPPMFPEDRLDEGLPDDLVPLADALDALVAADRASVPAGLPSRVYRATLGDLRDLAEDPVVYAFPAVRHSGHSRGLAMAATLGLLATVGAVWLSGQRSSPTAGTPITRVTETDLDTLLTLASLTDTTQADAFDELAADADEAARAAGESWMPDDLFYSEQSSEGSL